MLFRICNLVLHFKKAIKSKEKVSEILAGKREILYFCNVFHGIRFKVSEDWLS